MTGAPAEATRAVAPNNAARREDDLGSHSVREEEEGPSRSSFDRARSRYRWTSFQSRRSLRGETTRSRERRAVQRGPEAWEELARRAVSPRDPVEHHALVEASFAPRCPDGHVVTLAIQVPCLAKWRVAMRWRKRHLEVQESRFAGPPALVRTPRVTQHLFAGFRNPGPHTSWRGVTAPSSVHDMTFPTARARVAAAAPGRVARVHRGRVVTATRAVTIAPTRKSPSSPRTSTVIPGNPFSGAQPGDRIALTTMPATRPTLGISFWPDFDYDASGATTLGVVDDPDPAYPDAIKLRFDVRTFEGPSVSGKTTSVFGVPLPPGVRVDIVPLALHGWLDPKTGACALDFDAEFRGSIFGENCVKLPPLKVRSPLTTGDAAGDFRSASGKSFGAASSGSRRFGTKNARVSFASVAADDGSSGVPPSRVVQTSLNETGYPVNPCSGSQNPNAFAELVAVARVPRVTGPWSSAMNLALGLPSEAYAVLPCRLRIWDPKRPGVREEEEEEDFLEASVVRELDSRFEYFQRRTHPVRVSKMQIEYAIRTFGGADVVEESYQLYA